MTSTLSSWKYSWTTLLDAQGAEIDNEMAQIIYKECAEKLGKDWWK